MAASTVARSMASFFTIALIGFSLASAQSVSPSNATLPASESGSETVLRLVGGPIFSATNYNIAPLTASAGKGGSPTAVAIVPQAINLAGMLRPVDYTNASNLSASDIAFISCDPNGSNIDASTVVGTAGDAKPMAILLYSQTARECNLTGQYKFATVFTMISADASNALMTMIQLFPQSSDSPSISAVISANSTTTSQQSSPSGTADGNSPAPTTAVAMSILYSITGIITLLFLIIIATGAIRAHRHPERYGPRNGYAGRPRQSRAKGLARAMLETLPIVKFGDPEPVKPGNRDVELESGSTNVHHAAATHLSTVPEANEDEEAKSPAVATRATDSNVESGLGAAQADSVASGKEAVTREGELGCSICTEDFKTGEDVRVLPCHHKYHPACIDPWLLNVSGTCPLCRHDLRPVTSATENTENTVSTTGEGSELPPPLSVEGEEAANTSEASGSNHQRRGVARLLDLNRLRHAPPDERIAALRQLREQSQREGEQIEDVEETSRRARLTNRLRDTFRVRTREQASTPPSSSPSP
ncbi:hypothetical protein N431DRAFT_338950 [Stipitochalara longipes BDJ]|nr:hypothetical protein N431DRAFT_338950 [Stipitochalara longipes BDJ]